MSEEQISPSLQSIIVDCQKSFNESCDSKFINQTRRVNKVVALNSPTIVKKELRKAKQDKIETKEIKPLKSVVKPENKNKIKKSISV